MRKTTSLLIVVTLLLACGCAIASVKWAKVFKDVYKPMPDGAIAKAKCAVCHTKPVATKDKTLNVYGKQLVKKKVDAASLRAIEKLDADKDGFTNLAEIQAGTLPGDAKSKPAKAIK